jgi:hypothetical protein
MLAQVFNPTEIKNNGPATTSASAPARSAAFSSRQVVWCSPGPPKAIATQMHLIGAGRICRPDESR